MGLELIHTKEIGLGAGIKMAGGSGGGVSKKYVDEAIAAVDQRIDDLGVVFNVKGSVPTYADLPTEDNKPGDVWNVINTGDNYVYTESDTWDKLGTNTQYFNIINNTNYIKYHIDGFSGSCRFAFYNQSHELLFLAEPYLGRSSIEWHIKTPINCKTDTTQLPIIYYDSTNKDLYITCGYNIATGYFVTPFFNKTGGFVYPELTNTYTGNRNFLWDTNIAYIGQQTVLKNGSSYKATIPIGYIGNEGYIDGYFECSPYMNDQGDTFSRVNFKIVSLHKGYTADVIRDTKHHVGIEIEYPDLFNVYFNYRNSSCSLTIAFKDTTKRITFATINLQDYVQLSAPNEDISETKKIAILPYYNYTVYDFCNSTNRFMVGTIVQYQGPTTQNYKQGHFYKYIQESIPSEATVTSDLSSLVDTIDQTIFSGFYNSTSAQGQNGEVVFTYTKMEFPGEEPIYDWSYTCAGGGGGVSPDHFTQSTGITLTGAPQENDTFTVYFTQASIVYKWVEQEVQDQITVDQTLDPISTNPIANAAVAEELNNLHNYNSYSYINYNTWFKFENVSENTNYFEIICPSDYKQIAHVTLVPNFASIVFDNITVFYRNKPDYCYYYDADNKICYFKFTAYNPCYVSNLSTSDGRSIKPIIVSSTTGNNKTIYYTTYIDNAITNGNYFVFSAPNDNTTIINFEGFQTANHSSSPFSYKNGRIYSNQPHLSFYRKNNYIYVKSSDGRFFNYCQARLNKLSRIQDFNSYPALDTSNPIEVCRDFNQFIEIGSNIINRLEDNDTFQYIGESTQDYTQGYFYRKDKEVITTAGSIISDTKNYILAIDYDQIIAKLKQYLNIDYSNQRHLIWRYSSYWEMNWGEAGWGGHSPANFFTFDSSITPEAGDTIEIEITGGNLFSIKEQKVQSDSVLKLNVTLSATNWDANDLSQTIQVDGVKIDSQITISSSDAEFTSCNVIVLDPTSADSLTFVATSLPQNDITIKVTII